MKKTSAVVSKLKTCKTLDEALAILKVPDWWDALIVCDGSGTNWQKEAGWGWTLLVRRPVAYRQSGLGAVSRGSSVFAEFMGALHPILCLDNLGLSQPTSVFVLTDCKLVKDAGQGDAPNLPYTEMFDSLLRRLKTPLKIHWRHVPRDSLALNKLAHLLANVARKDLAKSWSAAKDDLVAKFD